MSLLEIASTPTTPADAANWSFAHIAQHRDIARVIFQKHNVNIDVPPIDPWTGSPEQLFMHQVMHDAQNHVLKIQGQNLMQVDWKDEQQVLGWIFENFVEHQQACTILNLG